MISGSRKSPPPNGMVPPGGPRITENQRFLLIVIDFARVLGDVYWFWLIFVDFVWILAIIFVFVFILCWFWLIFGWFLLIWVDFCWFWLTFVTGPQRNHAKSIHNQYQSIKITKNPSWGSRGLHRPPPSHHPNPHHRGGRGNHFYRNPAKYRKTYKTQ